MIKVINDNLQRLGVIKNAIDAKRTEEINGENTIEFRAVLDEKTNSLITDNAMFELDEDYFDIARLLKHSNDDGTYIVEVEAEHISYRLNDPRYNLASFLGSGNPAHVLGQILQGTGFTAGKVEFESAPYEYDIRRSISRRRLLMDYVDLLGGEVLFNKFKISILKKRGSQATKAAVKNNNVKVISRELNKRKSGKDGTHLISYTCQPLNLPRDSYELGDSVRLIDRNIGVQKDLRVVSYSYNPYLPTEAVLVFGTYINGFERPFYEATEQADNLTDDFVDRVVDEVIAQLPEFPDVVNSFTYSDTGMFSNAIVNRLRTDLSKPWRYLNGDMSDVHYQDIGDTDIASGRYFKVDIPTDEKTQYSIPAMKEGAEEIPLWWFDGEVGGRLTTKPDLALGSIEAIDPDTGEILLDDGEIIWEYENGPIPVMAYKYTTYVQHRTELRLTEEGWWGVRDQWGIGEDEYGRGAGIIEKTGQHMFFGMTPGLGEEIGGYRVSSTDGPEYYDTDLKKWMKPGLHGDMLNAIVQDSPPTPEQLNNINRDTLIFQYDPNGAPNLFGESAFQAAQRVEGFEGSEE